MFTRGLTFLLLLAACGPDGAPNAQRMLLSEHVPRIQEIVRGDREKTWEGVQVAAERFARGFEVADPSSREAQMRVALERVQEPPRGIPQFIASPMSFLAAVGPDGVVIARDGGAENDRMKGQDYGGRYPVVRGALAGQVGYELGEFGSDAEDPEQTSYSMLFAAPAHRNGQVVGAMVAGIPLWRESQRISRQLRLDHAPQIEQGLILWAFMYKGDRVFPSPDSPTEVSSEVPTAEERAAGLANSPGGFTGQKQLYGKWYGFAVVPLPTLGEDVGVIVFRADAPE